MNKKIVVTGMGAVTPVGIGTENYWNGILSGSCGIGDITRIDASGLPVGIAAEVKGFSAKEVLPARLANDLDVFQQYAFAAAAEALADSGLTIEPQRTGIVMGTALAGIGYIGDTQKELILEEKPVGPRFLTKVMGNLAGAYLAIQYGITGPCFSVSTACSSGGDAVTVATMLLLTGAADAVVAMAGDAALSTLAVWSLYKTGALSRTGSSRPFDKNRDGFVIGEGGGALVLETEEHARKRGANIRAELLGCANNTDGFHPVAPRPDGSGAAQCLHIALEQSGLQPESIGYLNAHGTATTKGDAAETLAIKAVFGDYDLPVSSTKGATGHMMGAGGITEIIACIKAIETGKLPPNIGYSEKDEDCALNIVANSPVEAKIDYAMSNALGFGGQNSSVVVGRYGL